MDMENVNSVSDLRKFVCEDMAENVNAKTLLDSKDEQMIECSLLASAKIATANYVEQKNEDIVEIVEGLNSRLDGNKQSLKRSLDVIRDTRMTFVRETTEITRAMDGFLAKKKDVETLLASVQKLIAAMNDPALKGLFK